MKIPELDEVRNKIKFARAQGLPVPTFDAYVELTEVAASLLDARAESARPARRNTTIIPTPAVAANLHSFDFPEDGTQHNAYSVNQHALYGNLEEKHNIDTSVSELAMYQCMQTDTDQERSTFRVTQAYTPKKFLPQATNQVSLDRATWHNLPNEDKAIWGTLSPSGKSAIINGTRQRGLEVAETCKTVKSKYTPNAHSTSTASPTPTPITNTRKVNVTDVESVPVTSEFGEILESNSHIQVDSDQGHSNDTNYPSENFLVSLAKSRLPPSDIHSILSQSSNKNAANARLKTPPDATKNLSIGFHNLSTPTPIPQWSDYGILLRVLGLVLFLFSFLSSKQDGYHSTPSCDTYRISAHKTTSSHGALVDRGANGGIAGSKVRIISTTGRTVDITGIDNHQLIKIKIGTSDSVKELIK
jgi:hypothetical protein